MTIIEEIKAELTRIKEMFASKQKFAQATLEDGTVVEWEGDLVAGTELFVVDGETRIPAPIGTHTTTEGLQVVVEEVGVVKEVIEAEPEPNPNEEFKKTERTIFSAVERERFAQISQINKWAYEIDQDTVALGTALTTSWTDSEGQTYTNPLYVGEYEDANGVRFLVDSAGVVRFIFSQTEPTDLGLSKEEVEAIVTERMSAVTKVMDDLLKVAESTQRELETFKALPSVTEREKTKFTKEGGDLTPRQQFLMNNLKK